MFLRSILFPSLIVSAIGMPMIVSDSWNSPSRDPNAAFNQFDSAPPQWGTPNVTVAPTGFAPSAPADTSAFASPAPSIANSNVLQAGVHYPPAPNTAVTAFPASTNLPTSPNVAQPVANINGLPSVVGNPAGTVGFANQPLLPGMTPDFGATETFVFPGNAHGPDLTAKPLDYVPVMNFGEVIRFDVYPNWVKSRWKRVSTSPGDRGLHGLRVACVTGTNSWDLHGSLTYYFDANQRAQRITFQGWTGDSSRLVNLLTSQFGLQAQPTHWAGCYVSTDKNKRRGQPVSGLLMQHPAVISTDNPVQQVALMMELNQAVGRFRMSESFRSMVQYALQTN